MNALIRSSIVVLAPLAIACSTASVAVAQCSSCQRSAPVASWMPASAPSPTQVFSPVGSCLSCYGGQEYKIVAQTVYDKHETTAFRVENETVYEDRTFTTYKPVWETQSREYRYRVAKPVIETSSREERYTVQKPVWETQVRDCSYNRVRWESVQCEREERSIVARPVYETAERSECYTVMRPVAQTTYRMQYRTVMQPVTTCQTQLVDQGCFANQMVMKPSPVSNRLAWQSGQSVCDPLTGRVVYQRPGLYWEPVQQGRYEVSRVWQPNVVAQQVQQTAMVPQTVAEQIPVNTVTYQPEQIVRKVPYQVCRMEQQEIVRKVPYTVMRPVTERVENQVQVKVCRMMTEECVRQVPVTTSRMVYEDRVEQRPVQVCRMMPVVQTVRVPHCVEKRTPLTYTYYTPRVVCDRIPLDACGNPIEAALVPQAEPATTVEESASETTSAQAPSTLAEPTLAKPSQPSAADQRPSLNENVAPPAPKAAATNEIPPAKADAAEQDTAPAWNPGGTTLPKAGTAPAKDWRNRIKAEEPVPADEPTRADEPATAAPLKRPTFSTTPSYREDAPSKSDSLLSPLKEDATSGKKPAPMSDIFPSK